MECLKTSCKIKEICWINQFYHGEVTRLHGISIISQGTLGPHPDINNSESLRNIMKSFQLLKTNLTDKSKLNSRKTRLVSSYLANYTLITRKN